MSKPTTKLTGLFAAMPAPFDERERFLAGTYQKLLRDQVAAGINGFLINGTMGIQPLLNLKTFEQVVEAASAVLKGSGCTLMVGCGDASAMKTLEKIRIAERYPIDYVTLTSPYYFEYSEVELKRYFQCLAAATDMNIMLYDNPDCTHNKLTVGLVTELGKLPNVRGIKCSGFDIHYIRMIHARFAERQDFSVICGVLHYMDMLIVNGLQAFMDGLWAVVPQLAVEMFEKGRAGDFEGSRRVIFKIVRLVEFMCELGLWPAYSAAMNILGYEGIYSVAPLSVPDERISAAMHKYMVEEEIVPSAPAVVN